MSDMRCPAVSRGIQCDLQAGHPDPHQFHREVELPAEVGQMLAGLWDQMEADRDRLRRRLHRSQIMWWVMITLAVMNAIGVVSQVVSSR